MNLGMGGLNLHFKKKKKMGRIMKKALGCIIFFPGRQYVCCMHVMPELIARRMKRQSTVSRCHIRI